MHEVKLIKGTNLFNVIQPGDIIIHGCNCFNTMGAGFALELKHKYPEAYEADFTTKKGDRDKLGDFTFCVTSNDITIINAYTQFSCFPRGKDHFEYVAFHNFLDKFLANVKNKTIRMPKIGAGLAGGDWGRIERIINQLLVTHKDNQNTIEVYSL